MTTRRLIRDVALAALVLAPFSCARYEYAAYPSIRTAWVSWAHFQVVCWQSDADAGLQFHAHAVPSNR
jgi:hypothetical protein